MISPTAPNMMTVPNTTAAWNKEIKPVILCYLLALAAKYQLIVDEKLRT